MSCSTLQLIDLPDEMLMEILHKLSTVDVLYSMLGVNKRFARLVKDIVFTENLDLTTQIPLTERCSLPNILVNEFCSSILPTINHQIKSFCLESSSMQRILLACDYPKLHKLTLCSITPEDFIQYLTDESPVVHILKKMTHLALYTIDNHTISSQIKLNTNSYARIFVVCERLTHLSINGSYVRLNPWTQGSTLPMSMYSSSNLLDLNVNVRTIDDCLRLLDGRFSQLTNFTVHIESIETPSFDCSNENDLLNLTTFCLISQSPTQEYDNVVLALLRRMSNVGKLGLYLMIENRPKFIDGAQLFNQIIKYMPQITAFSFDIITMDNYADIKYYHTNDDIEERFIIDNALPYIHCCIDYFKNGIGRCRVSSFPFM